jgi:hypothetical protein
MTAGCLTAKNFAKSKLKDKKKPAAPKVEVFRPERRNAAEETIYEL